MDINSTNYMNKYLKYKKYLELKTILKETITIEEELLVMNLIQKECFLLENLTY